MRTCCTNATTACVFSADRAGPACTEARMSRLTTSAFGKPKSATASRRRCSSASESSVRSLGLRRGSPEDRAIAAPSPLPAVVPPTARSRPGRRARPCPSFLRVSAARLRPATVPGLWPTNRCLVNLTSIKIDGTTKAPDPSRVGLPPLDSRAQLSAARGWSGCAITAILHQRIPAQRALPNPAMSRLIKSGITTCESTATACHRNRILRNCGRHELWLCFGTFTRCSGINEKPSVAETRNRSCGTA